MKIRIVGAKDAFQNLNKVLRKVKTIFRYNEKRAELPCVTYAIVWQGVLVDLFLDQEKIRCGKNVAVHVDTENPLDRASSSNEVLNQMATKRIIIQKNQ